MDSQECWVPLIAVSGLGRTVTHRYKGKENFLTITMEEIADNRLYFWNVIFEVSGCNNDITVLEASHLIELIVYGNYPVCFK